MAAENLLGNVPNKVGSDYQRPLPRDFEDATNGDVSWKDETGTYNWDTMPVLPAGKYRGFDTSVSSPVDGDIYFGTGDSTTNNSDWNASTVYDWARYTADTSSWSTITPAEGQLCFDTSSDVWYTFDTTTTGWNQLQEVAAETSYVKKTINTGDWNMDTTTTVTVAHGLSATEWKTIRSISTIIRDDADTTYYDLAMLQSITNGTMAGGNSYHDATNIELARFTTGNFDATGFDSTAYNRGWITFEYTKD